MANLDTRSKRSSSVGILRVGMLAPPLPDATISQGDRQHIAVSYSGILAAAAGGAARGLFFFPNLSGLGSGGSFFQGRL